MNSVQYPRLSRAHRVAGIWWVQWVAGLSCVALALLPWMFSGGNMELGLPAKRSTGESLLPHGVMQLPLLLTLLGFSAVLLGFLARFAGRRNRKFSILAGLGLLCGWLAALYQSWTMASLSLDQTTAIRLHVWTAVAAIVVVMLLYFGIAGCGMAGVAVCVALLSFAPGDWLAEMSVPLPVEFTGPVVLGLVLGCLGFDRASSLLLWCLALTLQWLVPPAMVTIQRAVQGRADLAELWEVGLEHAIDLSALHQSLATLATAMLISVALLVLRRIRTR